MKAVKVGNIGTEHDGYPPTKVTAGSPDVFIDGLPAARVGDPLEPHDKPNSPMHNRAIATGSSTVFINGKPAALTGGAVSCGGVTIGTGTVNIGDQVSKASMSPQSLLNLFDEQVGLIDTNNNPIEGYPYYAKTVEGIIYKGRTDAAGLTSRMPTQKPEHIEVLWGDEALFEGGDL
ncbi:type VI secretion system PAAR protein [Halodesulfovibrio aestuarii]|uniref:type VI secretion system PAAR protein n=1 Tax=Halodesulfovibrio aestuarii TaxID=126333 RepID=UPI003D33B2EF